MSVKSVVLWNGCADYSATWHRCIKGLCKWFRWGPGMTSFLLYVRCASWMWYKCKLWHSLNKMVLHMHFKFSFAAPLQFFIQNLAMFFTSFYKVCRLTSKFPPMDDYCSFNVYLFKVCACKWLKSYILKIGLTSCLPSHLPVGNYLFPWQSHISVLETTQENQAILLMGLEYLIGISYVEDTEVFKVWDGDLSGTNGT
jgi:hypothetical protein